MKMQATPAKLKSGDWGARVLGAPEIGQLVTITTRAGKAWDAVVSRVVWRGDDVTLAETVRPDSPQARDLQSAPAPKPAPKPAPEIRMIDCPTPAGQTLLPYQQAGVSDIIARRKRGDHVLLADEMGLGKTIQAVVALSILVADQPGGRHLIVCPASLRINWARELAAWLTIDADIRTVTAAKWPPGKEGGAHQIWIVSYNLLAKYRDQLRAQKWGVLIADEAHFLKSPKSARTLSLFGGRETAGDGYVDHAPVQAEHKILMTGTPIPNRPIEIFPVLKFLSLDWANWHKFVMRYCDGHRGRYGWVTDGASNLDDLQKRLRAGPMIRRLKSEVLTDLPAKRRQIISLPTTGMAAALRAEKDALKSAGMTVAEYMAAAEKMSVPGVVFERISEIRHQTALAKVPAVIEHINMCLSSGAGKIVIMAHHIDVIEQIAAEYDGAVMLHGGHSIEARQAAVDRFQSTPDCRVFVGSIQAAGVGITLTAAAHVIFAELDWVPGNLSQAEDRCHRIGQSDSVLVQHLVVDGSIDARIAVAVVRKQGVIAEALDAV